MFIFESDFRQSYLRYFEWKMASDDTAVPYAEYRRQFEAMSGAEVRSTVTPRDTKDESIVSNKVSAEEDLSETLKRLRSAGRDSEER